VTWRGPNWAVESVPTSSEHPAPGIRAPNSTHRGVGKGQHERSGGYQQGLSHAKPSYVIVIVIGADVAERLTETGLPYHSAERAAPSHDMVVRGRRQIRTH
jgi:hypothetical protein